VKRSCGFLALALYALGAGPAAAQSPPSPAAAQSPPSPAAPVPGASAADLQSPEQTDTRYSAYSLPRGVWGLDFGALGIGGGDAFAKLGVSYGFGAGIDAGLNLAHFGVGLLNVSAAWHFIDTRYFDLGFRAGIWYGHGEWFWTAQGVVESIVSKIDVLNVPMALTGSVPIMGWAQIDLGVQYTFSQLYGSGASTRQSSPFTDTELATRQFFFRPVARLFLSDSTALQLSAKLPVRSTLALENSSPELSFADTWSFEAGLRSRFASGFFGNLRLHYGYVSNVLYGARLYPSFELELRR
jgi:hypothetical protein